MVQTFQAALQERIAAAFAATGIELPEGFAPQVVPAADARHGDYQCNEAMGLAKRLRMNPREVAAQVIAHLDVAGLAAPPEIAGPGFINLRLLPEALGARLRELLGDERLGVAETAEPKTVVIDFSAPNVAKPMHVGHIRSTIIGDCLARVARFLGHRVITDNHIGDWGTQFGMVIYGWKHHLDRAGLEADPIKELVRVYKHVNGLQKEDAAIADACREELVKLQGGDGENLGIWRQCVDLSLRELRAIYARLGVEFDHYLGESFYNEALAPLVDKLIADGLARESDGAICVFFDGHPDLDGKPCLIRKSDGGFLYATTDLATIEHRVGEFAADEIWYVVGAPQQLHFQQLFEIAARRGIGAKLVHIPFGSILGPDRKLMRTRSGESVGLIEVLDEAVERARAQVEEKNPDLPEGEKQTVAEVVGIGAVKYAELSQFRMTDYVFAWDKMLALTGNTAPYLQYSYVRTRSIFRRLGDDAPALSGEIELAAAEEIELAKKLAQFAEIVPDVLHDHRPNLLAAYLLEVAKAYHSFFEACPVLRAEGAQRNTRLILCEVASRVLRRGLDLMGIAVTERM